MFKVSKKRRQNDGNDGRSDAFTVNCEHISHFILVFLLLTLGR